tara:strand:- start:2235 stop:2411 length:177 start_codon:yes stop_codon:yes gene_type:complete
MPHIPGHGFTTDMSGSISDILSSQGFNMSALHHQEVFTALELDKDLVQIMMNFLDLLI